MYLAYKNLAMLYEYKGFRSKAMEMWERALSTSTDVEEKQEIRKRLLGMI